MESNDEMAMESNLADEDFIFQESTESELPMPGEIWVAKSGTGVRLYVIGRSMVGGLIFFEIVLANGAASGACGCYSLDNWLESFRFESGGCDQ